MKKLRSFLRFLGLCLFPIVVFVGMVFTCTYVLESVFWPTFILSSVVTILLFLYTKKVKEYYYRGYRYSVYRNITAFASIAFVLANILYQFWFSEIISGFKLWHVLLALVILFVLFVVVRIILFFLKERKERRLNLAKEAKWETEKKEREDERKAEEEREKKEREKKDAERLEQIKKLIESINGKEQSLWSEIIPVARYYILCPSELAKILPRVSSAPLEQVIKISYLKKQIVWTGDLEEALEVIEKFADKSYDDCELNLLVNQLDSFLKIIEGCKDFKGYDEAKKLVESKCPTVFKFLSEKK